MWEVMDVRDREEVKSVRPDSPNEEVWEKFRVMPRAPR